jgi:hypothetical protein
MSTPEPTPAEPTAEPTAEQAAAEHTPFAWLRLAARQKVLDEARTSRVATKRLPPSLSRTGLGFAAPRPFNRSQWS